MPNRLLEAINPANWFRRQRISVPSGSGRSTRSRVNFRNFEQVSQQRRAEWNEIEYMDDASPIIGRALDVISDYAVTFPSPVHHGIYASSEDNDTQELLNGMIERLGLGVDAWELVRHMVKFGNMFAEVVIDPSAANISRLKVFPFSYQIQINKDEYGRLKDGDPATGIREKGYSAYEQTDDIGKVVAAFWPSQIVHFTAGQVQGQSYARPVLRSVRRLFRNLELKQDLVILAQMAVLNKKVIAHVPVASSATPEMINDALKKFMDGYSGEGDQDVDMRSSNGSLSESSIRPGEKATIDTVAVPRYFNLQTGSVVDTDIAPLQMPTVTAADLDDIKLDMGLMLARLGVRAKDINLVLSRAFIEREEVVNEAFVRFVRRIQANFEQGVSTLCAYELLLQGMNPAKITWDLIMPEHSWLSSTTAANARLSDARTGALWVEKLGIPQETAWRHLTNISPDELKALASKLRAQLDKEPPAK